MKTLLKTAIIGTAQDNNTQIATATAVDTLTNQLAVPERERAFLLTAGTLAIYEQAGQQATPTRYPVTAAPPEQLVPCNAQVAQLLREIILQKHNDLLLATLERIQTRQQRLPYDLLTLLLQTGSGQKKLRPLLLATLGERGHWLAQQNPVWQWATTYRADDEASDEIIWHDGILEQRLVVLQRLRTRQPDQARDWLAATWKQESAEERATLLAVLDNQLSTSDVAFLSQVLNDRAQKVREIAAAFLLKLPETVQAQRLCQQADALLQFQPHHLKHDEILVSLPDITSEEARAVQWRKDVDLAGTMSKKSSAEQWFNLVISTVPPQHWEQRFHTTCDRLIAALAGDPYETTLLHNWTRAALLHASTTWYQPLLDWHLSQLYAQMQANARNVVQASPLVQQLLERVEFSTIEQLLHDFQKKQNSEQLHCIFTLLPHTWNQEISRIYLHELFHAIPSGNYKNIHYTITSMQCAKNALHPDCFTLALTLQQQFIAENPDDTQLDYYQGQYLRERQQFIEYIHLRKRIQEEI